MTTEVENIKLVSKSNYHTTKHFPKKLLAIEMKKKKVKMIKPAYLGMSILDISKTRMYEFWYVGILLLIFLLKTFWKILTMTLKDGLIHLTMMRMIKGFFQ